MACTLDTHGVQVSHAERAISQSAVSHAERAVILHNRVCDHEHDAHTRRCLLSRYAELVKPTPPPHSIFRKMSENSKRYSYAEGTKHGPTFSLNWLSERSDARETLERARSIAVAKHASGSISSSGQAAEEIKKLNKRLNEQERRIHKKLKQARQGDP